MQIIRFLYNQKNEFSKNSCIAIVAIFRELF